MAEYNPKKFKVTLTTSDGETLTFDGFPKFGGLRLSSTRPKRKAFVSLRMKGPDAAAVEKWIEKVKFEDWINTAIKGRIENDKNTRSNKL